MASRGKPIQVIQHDNINESVNWSDTQEVAITGSSPSGLKVTPGRNGLAFSGKIDKPGSYEITITEKRVTKVIINVKEAESWLGSRISDVFMGKHTPKKD